MKVEKTANELEWHDISDEKSRTYIYADGSRYTVSTPLALAISRGPNGDSHRIRRNSDLAQVYVAAGWVAIEWDGPYQF